MLPAALRATVLGVFAIGYWVAVPFLALNSLLVLGLVVAYYRAVILPRRAYERLRLEERRISLQRLAARARDGVDTLLVPTDGSAVAQRALPVAARLAERLHANMRIFTATGKDPAAEILDEQERVGATAICMASHGRGRSAALIGSVASEVVRLSAEPVVLIGPEADETAPWLAYDLRRSGVVACIDESEEAAALLPVLMQWSRLLDEPPIVVTVVELVPEPLDDAAARRSFGPEGDAEAFLKEFVASHADGSATITTRVLYDPISPASGLRDYLREHPAWLAVAGAHNRTGASRLVFGSKSAAIVRDVPAPVLVVPFSMMTSATDRRARDARVPV
jgi:nucleotide-binding universal stress UspA family protein